MSRLLPLLLLCVLSPLPAAAQRSLPLEEGSPYYLQAFGSQDYGAHSQNWEVVQDQRGLIYVANTHGVLEYEGRTWRCIRLPEAGDRAVRSLALTSGGTVFVGGVGEVGYLAPDSLGLLGYVSLVSRLPEDDREFADVWTTHALGDTVFFQSFNRLFRWDGRAMYVWRSGTRYHKAFTVGGDFYVREEDVGLERLEGDRFVLVPGGAQFAWESVYAVLPHPGGLLIGTRSQGLFLLDAGGARPFQTEAGAYLNTYRPYDAMVLEAEDGRRLYVVATLGGGVLLLDEAGRLVRIYREDAGIAPDDFVLNATLDRQGGLWLALNSGIRRVDVLTPLTQFGLVHGLEGTVYDVLRHAGTLYVATSTGLFRLVPGQPGVGSDGQPRYARFEQVQGVPEQVWALLSDRAGVLAATNDGVYLLRHDGPQVLRGDKAFALYASPSNPDRVYVGLKSGLAVMTRAGDTWRESFTVEGIGDEIRLMEEDAEGQLWIAPLQGGLKQLRWRPDAPAEPQIASFGERDGLPGGTLSVRSLGGQLAVGALEGVYRYDESQMPPFRLSAAFAEALGGREFEAMP